MGLEGGLDTPGPEPDPQALGRERNRGASGERRVEAEGGSQVSSPCSASSRPETSATAASPPGRRGHRLPQSCIFLMPGPSARPCTSS